MKLSGVRYGIRVSPLYKEWANRFLLTIDRTLNSPDSWATAAPFIYDEERPDVIYFLASTDEIDKERQYRPKTKNIYGVPSNLSATFYTKNPIEVYIDATNFIDGVPISGLGKKEYRKYVINHETGHALGYGHLPCNSETQVCPLMYQMTLGIPENYEPRYQVDIEDYGAPRL